MNKKKPNSFADLLKISTEENWCTRPYCTTCGAMPFRTALKKLPKEEVINGLRELSRDFIFAHDDLFRLVTLEISLFGYGGELLGPLSGTPAGEQLKLNIKFQLERDERRIAYAASQTPEAIALRRTEIKAARLLATKPHRDRKDKIQGIVHAVTKELIKTPSEAILKLALTKDFGLSPRVIGSLVFKRLSEHYRTQSMSSEEISDLNLLANQYGGFWMKLQSKIVSRHTGNSK